MTGKDQGSHAAALFLESTFIDQNNPNRQTADPYGHRGFTETGAIRWSSGLYDTAHGRGLAPFGVSSRTIGTTMKRIRLLLPRKRLFTRSVKIRKTAYRVIQTAHQTLGSESNVSPHASHVVVYRVNTAHGEDETVASTGCFHASCCDRLSADHSFTDLIANDRLMTDSV